MCRDIEQFCYIVFEIEYKSDIFEAYTINNSSINIAG